MTHEKHLNEDELILSVIDKRDLTEGARGHLESCPECEREKTGFETALSNMGRLAEVYSPQPFRKIELDLAPRPVFGKFPAFAAALAILMVIAGTWWFASLKDEINEQATAQLMLEIEQDSQLLKEIAELVTRAEENYSPPIFTEPNGNYSQEFMEFVIPFEDDQNEVGKIGIGNWELRFV